MTRRLVLGTDGKFLPPAGLIERLAAVDPLLGLRWFDGLFSWALVCEWGPDDPRRAMIQRGEMGEGDAFDVIAFAPAEMSAEDAYHLLVQGLKQATRESVREKLANIRAWNEQQVDRNAAAFVDEQMGTMEAVAHDAFKGTGSTFESAPVVPGAELVKDPPKPKGRSK